jgi:hypothetical protein
VERVLAALKKRPPIFGSLSALTYHSIDPPMTKDGGHQVAYTRSAREMANNTQMNKSPQPAGVLVDDDHVRTDGDVYCSSRCGRGCTFAEYQQTLLKAQALQERLGPTWQVEVWDNLGWKYSATNGVASISPCTTDPDTQWFCIINIPNLTGISANGPTPEDAARNAARKITDSINAMLGSFNHAFGPLVGHTAVNGAQESLAHASPHEADSASIQRDVSITALSKHKLFVAVVEPPEELVGRDGPGERRVFFELTYSETRHPAERLQELLGLVWNFDTSDWLDRGLICNVQEANECIRQSLADDSEDRELGLFECGSGSESLGVGPDLIHYWRRDEVDMFVAPLVAERLSQIQDVIDAKYNTEK